MLQRPVAQLVNAPVDRIHHTARGRYAAARWRRVAVCGGAGDSLLDAVRANHADVYVTADMRHHPASEAREGAVNGRPYLIDVSHFASEWLWLPVAAEALGNVLMDQGFDVEIRVSSTNSDPWDFILTPGGD